MTAGAWGLEIIALGLLLAGTPLLYPAQEVPGDTTVSLAAVGDILLDRGVREQIEESGAEALFEGAAPLLRSAQIAVGNLECPLSEAGVKIPKPFSFRADPACAPVLRSAGFDLLCLANNHTMDCNRDGLVETMGHLRTAGLEWCGAGMEKAEAVQPRILEVNGLRLAFLGFCDYLPEGLFVREDAPTVAFATESDVIDAVAQARGCADVVIVFFHWGVEYTDHPSHRQRTLADAAVWAGADLILGHHPHVLQGLEWVPRPSMAGARPALVAYSLGNFVFDQHKLPNAYTIILECRLGRGGVMDAQAIPFRVQRCRPCPAGPADEIAIRQRLATLSEDLR